MGPLTLLQLDLTGPSSAGDMSLCGSPIRVAMQAVLAFCMGPELRDDGLGLQVTLTLSRLLLGICRADWTCVNSICRQWADRSFCCSTLPTLTSTKKMFVGHTMSVG